MCGWCRGGSQLKLISLLNRSKKGVSTDHKDLILIYRAFGLCNAEGILIQPKQNISVQACPMVGSRLSSPLSIPTYSRLPNQKTLALWLSLPLFHIFPPYFIWTEGVPANFPFSPLIFQSSLAYEGWVYVYDVLLKNIRTIYFDRKKKESVD